MKRAIWMLAVLALMLGGVGKARAGVVTASLTANPSTIPEGSNTNLTLSLTDTPNGYNVTTYYGSWGTYTVYGYTGSGFISNVAVNLYSGDGQTTIPISSTDSTNSVVYDSAGTYNPYVSGTVTTADYLDDYGTYVSSYNYGLFGQVIGANLAYFNDSGYVYNNSTISTSTQVDVYNTNPAAVPEPSTLTLLGIGAVCSLGYGWRRRLQSA